MRRPKLRLRTRVIIAVVTLAVAVGGHPWWISLVIGYGTFLWLLEPDDGNFYVG